MGYIAHHAVMITVHSFAWKDGSDGYKSHEDFGVTPESFQEWKDGLSEAFQKLIVVVPCVINGDFTIIMAPDGSKEGWGTSDEGDRIRAELIDMFSWTYDDGSSPFEVAEIRFGGDDPGYAWVKQPNDQITIGKGA